MKNVLIVDDDNDLLKLYKQAFLNAAFNVDAVLKLESADKLIKKTKYDIMLLDLLFPDTNALELIRQIRKKDSLNENTPIIALTNLNEGEITEKAVEYGVNECLFKTTQTPKAIFELAMKLSDKNSK